ncbi:MAG: FAD-binding oxidoreductase [Pseudomonadales bacterium]|nr:FAD-binding oxidoreductase [Pseudomonadales bacterium]
MSDTVIVIGGGMAGVSAAAELSDSFKVILLERESFHGVHSTGRSAASYIPSYGYDDPSLRLLTSLSKPAFDSRLEGLSEVPLLKARGLLTLSPLSNDNYAEELQRLRGYFPSIVAVENLQQEFPSIPVKPEFATRGWLEPDATDIDVDALLQAYLRKLKRGGGVVFTGTTIERIEHKNGSWAVTCDSTVFHAAKLINCAGAWADNVAQMAGASSGHLTPKRRTAINFNVEAETKDWPLIIAADESFYLKPDAGKLLASPVDATPSVPCDSVPEEIDIATAAYNVEQALALNIKRIDHSWAGLRTFAKDGSPVIGEDPLTPNFYWLAGQGGHGIQIAPAAAQLLASLVADKPLPDAFKQENFNPQWVSPARLLS